MPGLKTSAPKGLAAIMAAGVQKLAEDGIDYGMSFDKPPACIRMNDGRAELRGVSIGVFKSGKNQGKPFLNIRGVMVAPEYVDETLAYWEDGQLVWTDPERKRVPGAPVSNNYVLDKSAETFKHRTGTPMNERTAEENVQDAWNTLGMILGNQDGPQFIEQLTAYIQNDLSKVAEDKQIDALNAFLAPLTARGAASVYFKVGTEWGKKLPTDKSKNPSYFVNWGERDYGYTPSLNGSARQDDTPQAPAAKTTAAKPASPKPAAQEQTKAEEPTLDDLIAAAKAEMDANEKLDDPTSGPTDAFDAFEAFAKNAGVDTSAAEFKEAAWEDAKKMIEAALGGSPHEEEEEEEETSEEEEDGSAETRTPQKGDKDWTMTVKVTTVTNKGKKNEKKVTSDKVVKVEILSSNQKEQKAKVKRLDNDKEKDGVAFADLSLAE